MSAKDARTMSAELRTDAGFVEGQEKLSFAAFVRGQTKHAVSISITPGQMERLPRLNDADRKLQRDFMRKQYAVHYSEIANSIDDEGEVDEPDHGEEDKPDNGGPMVWE